MTNPAPHPIVRRRLRGSVLAPAAGAALLVATGCSSTPQTTSAAPTNAGATAAASASAGSPSASATVASSAPITDPKKVCDGLDQSVIGQIFGDSYVKSEASPGTCIFDHTTLEHAGPSVVISSGWSDISESWLSLDRVRSNAERQSGGEAKAVSSLPGAYVVTGKVGNFNAVYMFTKVDRYVLQVHALGSKPIEQGQVESALNYALSQFKPAT